MKEIALTRGLVALVDDADFDMLSAYKWYTMTKGGCRYYARASVLDGRGTEEYMHRLLLGCPDAIVDHINRNGLDNRRENLRICTVAQNSVNRIGWNKPTTSKYKGVSWSKYARSWSAHIMMQRKNTHLGYFRNEIEAARAYNIAALKAWGDFARLNDV